MVNYREILILQFFSNMQLKEIAGDKAVITIPEDKDGKGGNSHDAGHKDNIITFRIPKV